MRSKINTYLPKKLRPREWDSFLPETKKPDNDFKKIIKFAKELTLKNNSNFYFIYLPEYRRFISDYDNSSYIEIRKIINDLDIPFIDINKLVFEKEENPLKLFPYSVKILLNSHYNKLGYNKIAQTILTNTIH
tara:strand:- start:103 stop:501 length:399 start_codon:yes stop_codon:yes gene_type:complete